MFPWNMKRLKRNPAFTTRPLRNEKSWWNPNAPGSMNDADKSLISNARSVRKEKYVSFLFLFLLLLLLLLLLLFLLLLLHSSQYLTQIYLIPYCARASTQSFVIINQKGVDPLSLDIFAKEGILCLRRAKRRNMERLTLACGGSPIHSLQDMEESQLGYAGKVSQVTLGEDKFTFVEDCANAKSCSLLLQGPNDHSIQQSKDAVKDGLRALKNALEDKAVIPGAGAFEIATYNHLIYDILPKTSGKAKLGIQAFADSLLIIPKTLAENSGLDVQTTILTLQEERQSTKMLVGLDVSTGETMLPQDQGVWDNVRVKRQSLYLSTVLASQLLLVDEVMRAGKQMGKQAAMEE